jgi:hypothetical protein
LTQTLFCWWTCCTTWGTRPTCQGTRSRCTPNESMSKSQASRRTSLFENWFVQSATTFFYPRLCANFKFSSTSFEPCPLRHQAASTAIKRCSITGQVVWHCDRILLYFFTVWICFVWTHSTQWHVPKLLPTELSALLLRTSK